MGRAGRVNVKRKEVEIARAINQAPLRRHTGVLRKGKIENETFLTGPASLEMFSTAIWNDARFPIGVLSPQSVFPFAEDLQVLLRHPFSASHPPISAARRSIDTKACHRDLWHLRDR
jgi:hypothetical protein